MPALHQVSSLMNAEDPTILFRHSINSLLDRHDILASETLQIGQFPEETMSINDLFGLDSPRGLLDFASRSTNGLWTPPVTSPNFQVVAPPKHSSALSFGGCSSLYSENKRKPDVWSNDSPLFFDAPGSDSSENLTDLLNSLTLNDRRLDLANFQTIQALNKCLPSAPRSTKWSSGPALPENLQLDRAARFHRSAASVCDATCTWSGLLPTRTSKPFGYSSKVFLGGVPWDISEHALVQVFKQFGPVRVEWPGKERQACQPKGYAYIIFESENHVRALLQACTTDASDSWYFKINSKRMKAKEVQVIPWILNDSNFIKSTTQKLDPSKTVFVGALHGMLNAEGLAKIMNDLFDGVIYTGIDTDKYKYPIGSGRVTFNNPKSYMKAVAAAFIEIKTARFSKKVQVDPYLEDSLCAMCCVQQGPYFCRDLLCFRYFCSTCWQLQHNSTMCHHKPLMRISKHSTGSTGPN